jgi:integrase
MLGSSVIRCPTKDPHRGEVVPPDQHARYIAAVDLASHTGLRLGDLVRVAWSHVADEAIVLSTGKSRHRREAIIPLYGELRDVLARMPKRATTILTNSRHRPWTADGFGSSFNKAKIDAGMSERDLHFNDLRGTAATNFYIAGFTMREIAETLGKSRRSKRSFGDMSDGPRPSGRESRRWRPENEQKLQNRQQNCHANFS